ncbi:MAG: FBP domain-containing protein [Archangium sp.]|nr:FBP domain-containing protein [Archangium sp.]
MFRLQSEDALKAAFRPKDALLVEPPAGLKYPFAVLDYLSWVHPAGGGLVFIVFATPGGTPTGIAFTSNGGTTAAIAQMCDWCHTVGVGTQVGLLTARLNANKRVGMHLCADLSCRQKIEDEANRAGRSPVPALKKLVEKIGLFASSSLKIDLNRP